MVKLTYTSATSGRHAAHLRYQNGALAGTVLLNFTTVPLRQRAAAWYISHSAATQHRQRRLLLLPPQKRRNFHAGKPQQQHGNQDFLLTAKLWTYSDGLTLAQFLRRPPMRARPLHAKQRRIALANQAQHTPPAAWIRLAPTPPPALWAAAGFPPCHTTTSASCTRGHCAALSITTHTLLAAGSLPMRCNSRSSINTCARCGSAISDPAPRDIHPCCFHRASLCSVRPANSVGTASAFSKAPLAGNIGDTVKSPAFCS